MNRRRFKKVMKAVAILCALMLLFPLVAYTVLTAPTGDDCLLRVDVVSPHSESVRISAPLTLIHTVFDLLPREIRQLTEKARVRPEDIQKELELLRGEDLVRIEGRETVRIWLQPVTPRNRRDLGFVKIHVEKRRHGETIDICIPRGLVQLAGKVVRTFGLVDKAVDMPHLFRDIEE